MQQHDGRHVAAFCLFSFLCLFRIAGRQFHSDAGYGRVVGTDCRSGRSEVRCHRARECQLYHACFHVGFSGGRTPLTAIVLITEITGHFEVFYPSVVVGGLTYYFTELLQMKPSNVSLYEDMIHAPDFKEEKRYTLSVEIMTDSYLDGKLVDELSLPERCVIINVHRDGKNLVPAGTRLIPGDQVQIEMDSQDIEKLYEPLVSMANIY